MSNVNIAQPDVMLMLDEQGVIREATLSNSISGESVGAWLGRPWLETVGDGDAQDVRRAVEDARAGGICAFRQVVQRFPSGLELPIEYTTLRVDGAKAGLLAMGKNLQVVTELRSRLAAAQRATEQEYWKLRELETRYRLLFDTSVEAVLMIGAEDFRIAEANPAAVRALGLAPGWDFLTEVAPGEREGFRAMLLRVREHGRAPGVLLHLQSSGQAWLVRASLMASGPGLRYLLNIASAGTRQPKPGRDAPVPLGALIERLPDGFVVLSGEGTVLRANRAFLDLVQVGAEGAVVGEPLGRWLSRPGFQLADLLATVRRHRSVRALSATVLGELGTETEVELSAAGNADADPEHLGVLLRDVARRSQATSDDLPGAGLEVIGEQLGKVPLLQLVRQATVAVERGYVTAALHRAGGNRTVAAELLGLSRQSLHTKLNRYSLGSHRDEGTDM